MPCTAARATIVLNAGGGSRGVFAYGDDGNDTLRGNAGDDNLIGGAGDDYLTADRARTSCRAARATTGSWPAPIPT